MNVDLPLDRSSLAPILVNIASNTGSVALFAGTNMPIWAMMLMMATCLI